MAERSGVSQQYISRLKSEGVLVADSYGLFDMSNPVNQDWMRRRGVDENIFDDDDDSDEIPTPRGWEKYPHLTLKQYVLQHFSDKNFDPIFANILNTLMSAQKRDVDIQEKRRKLIDKDFVQSHLLQFIDIMQNQLLPYPESLIDEFISEVKADEKRARMNIPERMRKDISRFTKESIKLTIKNL